jgi:hypothetical protein
MPANITNCIYCNDPDEHSESHIIPEALGKGPGLLKSVCKKCNNQINTDVENPVTLLLAPLRNFLQLSGKRGKRAPFPVEVKFGDKSTKVYVSDPEELLKGYFVFKGGTDHKGVKRNITIVSLDRAAVDKVRKQYKARHPESDFREIPPEVLAKGLEYWFKFDLAAFADPRCLRMVAKIALEWWYRLRHLDGQQLPEFKETVDYIINDTPAGYPLVSLMDNWPLLGFVAPVPFPIHTVVLTIDPRSRNLVLLVGLFSLVYYKVVLTRRHHSLGREYRVFTVNPQSGEDYEPVLRASFKDAPFINSIQPADARDPLEVLKANTSIILARLNEGMSRLVKSAQ